MVVLFGLRVFIIDLVISAKINQLKKEKAKPVDVIAGFSL
jgi:hypothetical protein